MVLIVFFFLFVVATLTFLVAALVLRKEKPAKWLLTAGIVCALFTAAIIYLLVQMRGMVSLI